MDGVICHEASKVMILHNWPFVYWLIAIFLSPPANNDRNPTEREAIIASAQILNVIHGKKKCCKMNMRTHRMLADTTERIVLLVRLIRALLALHDDNGAFYHGRVCSDLENFETDLAHLIMLLIVTSPLR